MIYNLEQIKESIENNFCGYIVEIKKKCLVINYNHVEISIDDDSIIDHWTPIIVFSETGICSILDLDNIETFEFIQQNRQEFLL